MNVQAAACKRRWRVSGDKNDTLLADTNLRSNSWLLCRCSDREMNPGLDEYVYSSFKIMCLSFGWRILAADGMELSPSL